VFTVGNGISFACECFGVNHGKWENQPASLKKKKKKKKLLLTFFSIDA
jgi:hypothetical protein